MWSGLADGLVGVLPVGFLVRKVSGADARIARAVLAEFAVGMRRLARHEWDAAVPPMAGDVAAAACADATKRAVAHAEKRLPRSCARAKDAAQHGRRAAHAARVRARAAKQAAVGYAHDKGYDAAVDRAAARAGRAGRDAYTSLQQRMRADDGGAPPALLHQRVMIVGLQAKPEYNGRTGVVQSYARSSGRYVVALNAQARPGATTTSGGGERETLKARAANLRVLA